eukprot:GEZU01009023.1.p1 GENE.GEZU01009023.1~~GEZU01009023.1.p1  ORF type:complete len:105 (-),score=7.74 GEZU01009023.1:14-328(-)
MIFVRIKYEIAATIAMNAETTSDLWFGKVQTTELLLDCRTEWLEEGHLCDLELVRESSLHTYSKPNIHHSQACLLLRIKNLRGNSILNFSANVASTSLLTDNLR